MTLENKVDSFKMFHPDTDKKGITIALDNQVEGMFGVQIGCRNVSFYNKGLHLGISNTTKKIDGGQVGLYNCAEEINGIQIGLLCIADSGKYLQIGLMTCRDKEGPWYKSFTPFIGFSTKDKYVPQIEND